MKVLKTFGERLAQLRREKSADEMRDVSQGEVAKAVGMEQYDLSRLEKRATMNDTEATKRLAAYYKVNWLWLLHGEEGGEKALSKPPINLPRDVAESIPKRGATVARPKPEPAHRRAGGKGG